MNPKIWALPQNIEGQVFEGLYETDDCWDFSAETLSEELLGLMWGQFSTEAQQFFITNGYSDANGNFALSRRYIAVLSGVTNRGNYQLDFWTGTDYSADVVGLIPRSMLDFVPTSQNDPNYSGFVTDFFNPASVTPAMIALGKQFLTYVSIKAKNEPPLTYEQVTQLQPVQLGVPIPKNVSLWNASTVAYDGSTQIAHAVVGNGGTNASKVIGDTYLPYQKTLTGNYLIGIMTVPTFTINTTGNVPTVSLSIIQQFINILRQIGQWTTGLFSPKII